MILFRIIGPRDWDNLRDWHDAIPQSRIEHVQHGIYVLIIEPGGARRIAG